jgi:hypothetical protein
MNQNSDHVKFLTRFSAVHSYLTALSKQCRKNKNACNAQDQIISVVEDSSSFG